MESDSSSANSSELLALEENNVPDIFVQSSENKQIFTELLELKRFDDGYQEWVEISRWIKYQEEVEPEGNRWSKPHISTPSLRGWLELRKGLNSGLVLVDCEAVDFASLCQLISDELINRQIVNNEIAEKLVELWQKKHRHQFEGKRQIEGKLTTVFKEFLVQKLESSKAEKTGLQIPSAEGGAGSRRGSIYLDGTEGTKRSISDGKVNVALQKKISAQSEAAVILEGAVGFQDKPL